MSAKRGAPAAPAAAAPPKAPRLPPIPGLATSSNPNDDRVILSSTDMLTLHRLALSEPVVRACTRILVAACLGSNLELRRGGEKVSLKSQFEKHLAQHWCAFAADCIHSMLCWGVVPIVLVPPPKAPFGMPEKPQADRNLLPRVADMSSAQIVMERTDMSRTYSLETPQGDPILRSWLAVHDEPTWDGALNSPMQALRAPLLGMAQLQENALQAEAVRSRLLICTQIVPRLNKDDPAIQAQNLFFDSGKCNPSTRRATITAPDSHSRTLARVARPGQRQRGGGINCCLEPYTSIHFYTYLQPATHVATRPTRSTCKTSSWPPSWPPS